MRNCFSHLTFYDIITFRAIEYLPNKFMIFDKSLQYFDMGPCVIFCEILHFVLTRYTCFECWYEQKHKSIRQIIWMHHWFERMQWVNVKQILNAKRQFICCYRATNTFWKTRIISTKRIPYSSDEYQDNGILHIIIVLKGRNSGDCNLKMKSYMQLW